MGDNDSVQSSLNNVKKHEKIKYESIFKKLQKCGFSSHRCMKAIVATGLSNERAAGEWLAAHVDDEELDSSTNCRDFYISLCPKGSLSDAVKHYWDICQFDNGWCQAQEYPPHVTIIPRFQLEDHKLIELHHVLRSRLAQQPLNHASLSLPLELLITCDALDPKKNFIGYQATSQAKLVLEQFSNAILKDLDAIGIEMDESVRRTKKGIYHLSLSYGFLMSQQNSLVHHANEIVGPKIRDEPLSQWECCLFSSDSRLLCVEEMYSMRTNLPDWQLTGGLTIDYSQGDMVGLLSNNCNRSNSLFMGINLCTGKTGVFQIERGERVPLSLCWVEHLRLSLENTLSDRMSILDSPLDTTLTIPSLSVLMSSHNSKSDKRPRRVYVMRHGERVDFCFRNWISKCFDGKGVYKRHNLNMPAVLPRRKPEQYFHDCPLTVIGSRVAYETGVALRRAGVTFKQCYSSPALRCVQTAACCLRGLVQEDIGIRIEPSLFEWLGWYKGQLPSFLSAEQLQSDGMPVQTQYSSFSRLADLRLNETPSQYYERKGRLVKRLVDQNRHKGTSLLIVGHAASLDVCTRPLINKSNWPPQITEQEFQMRSAVVPFCGIVVAEERTLRWQLVDSPILTFTHCKNGEFNWRDSFLTN